MGDSQSSADELYGSILPGYNTMDGNNIQDIKHWHKGQEVLAAVSVAEPLQCTFNFVTRNGQLVALIGQELFSVLSKVVWSVHTKRHCAMGVRWIKKPHVHPFRWEVRVWVALATWSCDLVLGASTRGEGHYVWMSGTPHVLAQVRDKGLGWGKWWACDTHCCLLSPKKGSKPPNKLAKGEPRLCCATVHSRASCIPAKARGSLNCVTTAGQQQVGQQCCCAIGQSN